MNFAFVAKQIALLIIVLSGFMLLVAGWAGAITLAGAAVERDAAGALLVVALSGLLMGGAIWLAARRSTGYLDRRQALLLVVLSWLAAAVLGGAPYCLWTHLASLADHPYRSPIACVFEAMSGLTTTGATVLTDIEAVPDSLLLWRACTHWFGGLGIIVLFVAVLPSLGVGGRRLFGVESPGPQPGGVHPQIRDTARVLWYIYTGLTAIQIVALKLAGMSFFDATCHAFATLATGGFSTKSASVGAYNAVVQIIIIVFMVLAGGNFGLYHSLLRGRWRPVWRDPELRVYLVIIGISVAAIAFWINGTTVTTTMGRTMTATPGVALREAAFNVTSIQTTTGFCVSDFDLWPSATKFLLVVLMFVGGCAGSTAGGVKVVRLWITFKVLANEIERIFRPNIVRPVRLGGRAIDNTLRTGAVAYCFGTVLLFVLGAFVVMALEGPDAGIDTAASATVACLCNVGPGLGAVGAIRNYGWMNESTLGFLTIMMLMGRLEVLPVLVLLVPSYWRGE